MSSQEMDGDWKIVSGCMKEVLEEKGPLHVKVLAFFVEKKIKENELDSHDEIDFFRLPELVNVIAKKMHSFLAPYQSAAFDDMYVRLASRIFDPIQIECHENYLVPYLELLEKFKAVKANPDLLELPDSWLDKILGQER